MPADGLGSTDQRTPPLVAALRSILRPLTRLLLTQRFTYPGLASLLKELYVEAALYELERTGGKQTDSQVSIMTGVHRKDVRRLRDAVPAEDHVPMLASRGGQLALRWVTTPGYQDEEGRPLPLPRVASDVETPCFDALASSLSKDIRPRALLDELLELGVARLDDTGRVCLRVEGFVPEAGFEEKAFYFGRSVRDHIAAAAHNLTGQTPPMFERCVYYTRLTPSSVRELEELWNAMAMDALRTVNRRGAALQKRDAGDVAAFQRVTLGGYFFATAEDDEHAEPGT